MPTTITPLSQLPLSDDVSGHGIWLSSELVQRTKQAVHTVRSDRTKEVSYMTWAMKTRDLLRQGREEGREEGRKEGREEMRETGIKALVVTLKRLSQTLDLVIQTVAEQFDLSLEEAEEKTKQYWYK